MDTETKIILTVIACLAVVSCAICTGVINGQNRVAEVRKAEIEARCKFVGDEIVRNSN